MVEKLVLAFATAAHKHGIAIEQGDYKVANNNYEELHKCYLKLKHSGSVTNLSPLMSDPSPQVRLWAARYLLKDETGRAISVLESLTKLGNSSVAFDAKFTLLEWKAGNLSF